jgi:hypothetical protein
MNDTTVAPPSRLGWMIRVSVYTMLVASAAVTFLLNNYLWRAARLGSLPVWAPLVPVATFTAFVIVYAVDRWLLIRRRHYPMMRAFFQVCFAVLFLTLLWPRQAAELERAQHPQLADYAPGQLLAHGDDQVRAAACELVGLRGQLELRDVVGRMAQGDRAPLVRSLCAQATERLARLAAPATP